MTYPSIISQRNAAFALTLVFFGTVTLTLIGSVVSTLSLEFFEDNIQLIFVFNSVSIIMLTIVIVYYVWRLLVQQRKRIPGTLLTMRFLRIFTLVTVFSLSLVYCFSFFSIRGLIDGWVNLQIKATVDEANQLRELFIASIQEKLVSDLKETVVEINKTEDPKLISNILFGARNIGDYEEITYFVDLASPTGIVASSSRQIGIESLVPRQPTDKLIERVMLDVVDNEIEPAGEIFNHDEDGPLLRLLIPVQKNEQNNPHYLQVIKKLSQSSQRLAEKIGSVNERYDQMIYLRKPIQINFVLTLTLVTLVVVLLATLAAIKLTRRLVEPIRVLSEGTRKVAAGDYDQSLPVTTRDDLGVLVESFNDMTEKIKTSQEEIEEQRAYLEIVLRHLSSGVLFIDGKPSVTNINLAASSILRVDLESVRDRSLEELIVGNQNLAPLLLPIKESILAGQEEWSDTVKLDTAKGLQVLAYSTTRIPADDTEQKSYVVVVEDITDLVKAQRGAAWGEVAKRMTHEILNPLQPIRFAIDRIRLKTDRKLSAEDSKSLVLAYNAINWQLDSMANNVKKFRDYEKLSKLKFETVNLNKLIQETVVLYAEGDSNTRFNFDFDPALDEFSADPDQLIQVLNNLLINAKDATRDSDELLITIQTKNVEPNSVLLRITDNGPGFNHELLDRAFEPYATSKEKGLGLGLSIVKRIVDGHGGTITASNHPDGGAEMTIVLDTQFFHNQP